MLSKVYYKLRQEGVGGFVEAILHRCGVTPRDLQDLSLCLACYPRLRPHFRGKVGLEIGGPSPLFQVGSQWPVYAAAKRIDNVDFSRSTVWQADLREGRTYRYDDRKALGRQFFAEAAQLDSIASGSYPFVLSSHVLEHCANPLRALAGWVRVLEPGGVLVLAVPHRDATFDHRRPVTALEHLVQDFERNTPETDLTHLPEILALHDLARDHRAGDAEAFRRRSERNFENRCLHHHVFDTRLAVDVVHRAGLQILAVEPVLSCHILIVARRPGPGQGQAVDNARFRGEEPEWRSPFPSDRRSGDQGSGAISRTENFVTSSGT